MVFWSLESGPGFKRQAARAGSILEALILSPERFEGQIVTVQGQFRGRNLFEDLPPESHRAASVWVLRDGPFSIWVTGRAPRGKGWSLDPASRTDTAWRVEVDARVVRRDGLVFLEARQVRLVQREPDSSP